MTTQLLPYLLAIAVSAIAFIVAAYAYLFHRKEFWKISEWERMRVDRSTVESLRRQIEANKSQLDNLEKSLSDANDILRQAEADREFLEKHPNLKAEREALAKGLEDFSERTRRASEQLTTLEERRGVIVSEISALEAKSQGLREWEARQKEVEEKVRELDARKAQLTKELQDSEGRLNRIEQEMETITPQLKEARELVATIDTFEVQAANRKQQLEQLEKRFEDVKQKVQEFDARKTELTKEIKDSESRLQQARKDLEAVTPQLKEARELVAKIDAFKAQEKLIQESVKSLQGVLETITRQVENAGPTKYEERYADLFKPLVFPNLPAAKKKIPEQAAFNQMSSYIRDLGLKFPERVLCAFHTALKINDISPITVLAGISGTGKSLLPRRYAEGMGIHFVSLAVQPRWDSPQDLFGFYNYLERRYKATDLARAIVQFVQQNHADWPVPKGWDHGRQDRMLLVLLDEMNLARIEYYFSDFLSKLETRRDIANRDDPAERAKAEIALDMGSLKETEKPIRLFPSENVLFTGTMNEDESTQTLSDKVLDRSCVLRFGRPQVIDKYEEPKGVKPVEHGLPFETWKTWIAGTDTLGAELSEVNEWIGQVLEAMDDLGRPFGHRVILAIQQYIANYPQWIPDRINLAKADLIEQRIMPKLRGVDIDAAQKPLDEIQKMVSELGDRKLLDAFSRGRQDRTVFAWQGLDRSGEE